MSRRMRNGGQQEMRGRRKFKKKIVISGCRIEGKRGNLKRDNCEARMKGKGGENERQLIISSSLYKSNSEPGSLRRRVLKHIMAVTEGALYSALRRNYKRI